MKVSCIVCHHKGNLVINAINSILRSRGVEIDLIVATSIQTRTFARAKTLYITGGPSRKRNLAFRFAESDLIAFFDDDVEVTPDCILEMVQIIKRDGVGCWFIDKVHVNYFDKRSLNTVLQEAGFEAVFWGASCPIELFQLAGFRYIGNDKKGQQVHLARLRLEKVLNRLSFRAYKILFNRFGWGREIICIAKLKKA